MRTLQEWLTLQESVHPQAIDLGLARISKVARTLGIDKSACPVITVGGTNGKGSTVTHAEAFLRAGGLSTGLFTSPHFIRYNERICVNGAEVTDEELVSAFERIEGARGQITLTYFEFNALAALLIFTDRKVDAMVLEVGLGGRLDAANLIDADVGVVCSIGFDHRDWLGDTLELIGAEKAGIFRPGRPAVLGTDDMPRSVYEAIGKLGARGVVAGKDFTWSVNGERWNYRGLKLSFDDLPPSALAGHIQYRNAATALAAVESLGLGSSFRLDYGAAAKALGMARLAGRFQIVAGSKTPLPAGPRGGPGEWILDIAHNEPAAKIFAEHVRARPVPGKNGRTFAVIGILGDKDAREIVGAAKPLVDHWVACSLPGPRGTTAQQLVQRLDLASGSFTLADSVAAGCEAARAATGPADRVLVFGSVQTVGPALQWLRIY
ncbi:MAG TPA: bifunctional tetrahydrofolate synthase/dihydrofolate synthase [Steroidobacteraceae bacterium]